jgi:hypothetical protein
MRECDGHRAEHAACAEQLIQLHSPPYSRIDATPAQPTPSRREALCVLRAAAQHADRPIGTAAVGPWLADLADGVELRELEQRRRGHVLVDHAEPDDREQQDQVVPCA